MPINLNQYFSCDYFNIIFFRNNTNNFLSAELLQSALNIGQGSQISTFSTLNPATVRISMSNSSEPDEDKSCKSKGSSSSDKDCDVTNSNNAKNNSNNSVNTNPMSVSVPNLTTETNSQIEATTTAGNIQLLFY